MASASVGVPVSLAFAGSDDLRDCGVAWLGCLSLECSDENQSDSDHSEPDPSLSAEVLAQDLGGSESRDDWLGEGRVIALDASM